MSDPRADFMTAYRQAQGEPDPNVKGPQLLPYKPTARDRIANWLLGDSTSPVAQRTVRNLVGSTGLGTTGLSLADLTPVGAAFGLQDAARSGDAKDMAMSIIPGGPGRKLPGLVPKGGATPFYGDHVGPKGRIADPTGEADRLNLAAGVAGDPRGGFFNPASSALLQGGVHPRNTVTYYQKQMGSRGGTLPPGQWEAITQGWGPKTVVDRDELVRRIDQASPNVSVTRAGKNHPFRTQWDDYTTGMETTAGAIAPDKSYTETLVGYRNDRPKPKYADGRDDWRTLSGHVGHFEDPTHTKNFSKKHNDGKVEYPNIEGWIRSQNIPSTDGRGGVTMLIDELQDQRRRMYSKNQGLPTNEREAQMEALRREYASIAKQLSDPDRDKNSAMSAIWRDQINDISANIQRINNGVSPSPYTHLKSASAKLLTHQAVIDAASDPRVNKIAWPDGLEQALRYGHPGDTKKINGMKSFYGSFSAPYVVESPGMLGNQIQSLLRKVDPDGSHSVTPSDLPPSMKQYSAQEWGQSDPMLSIQLNQSAKDKLRRIGVPLYALPPAVLAAGSQLPANSFTEPSP